MTDKDTTHTHNETHIHHETHMHKEESAPHPRKIGLLHILGWIFGILFMFASIGAFMTSIPSGIFMFLSGLIIFPPANAFLIKKFNISLSRPLRIIACLVLLVIATSLVDQSPALNNAKSGASLNANVIEQLSTQQDTPAEPISKKFNDRIVVGDFAYTFTKYQTAKEIDQDMMGTFFGKKADGMFMIIDVTIENVAKETKTMYSSTVKVVDGEGREYEHDAEAEMYLPDHDSFIFEQMQPRIPKKGKIVFHVPETMNGSIEVSSNELFSSDKVYVRWG